MSLRPLDDRRGDGQPTTPEGQSQQGRVGRLWHRVRSLLTRVADRVGSRGDTETQTDEAVRALPEDDPDPALQGHTIETLPRNLELVSSEEEGTLTVTDAENPDATITSDTWESVER